MNAAAQAKPLAGWRVLVPRGGKWGDGVAATLRGFGAIPVIAPLINFAGAEDPSALANACLLYTSPSPRDRTRSRMPSSA